MKFWRTGLILLAVQMSAVPAWGQAIEVDNLRSLTLNFSAAAGQPCAGCMFPVVVTTSNSEIPLAFSVTTTPSWLSVSSTQNIASPQQAASFTVMADTTALPAGIYGGTITLACDEGFTCTGASITVNLIVNGADLSASPNPYDVTIATGRSPAVGVALTGAASISASVTSGASFIQAPQGSVSSPGTLMLTLNQSADLSPGLYTGTVLLTCVNGTFCLPLTVTINITVKTALNIDPNKLSFTAVAGQPATCSSPSCLVTVDSTAAFLPAVTVSASTTTGGNWLTAGAQSVGENIQFNVSASAVGLQAGNYSGTITAECSGDCISASIPVTLTVTAAPTLSAGTVSKTLTATAGQTQTQCGASCMASFPLSASSGSLTYQIAASSTGNWLGVSPTSGTATTTASSIMVTANPAGLAANAYTGMLTISCAAPSSCAPVSVGVNLTVTGAPTLSAGTVSKTLMATAGQTQAQCGASCMASFPLSASSGSLTYQIAASSTGNWLGVSPTSGTATTTASSIMVTANPAGLAANAYTGMLTISCAAPSSCATVSVVVNLTVAAAPTPTLTGAPSSISFTAGSGQTATCGSNCTFTVTASSGSLNFSATATTTSGGNWLKVSPTQAGSSGPATLMATASAATLQIGTYSGSITLACDSGSACSPVTIPVSMNVTGVDLTVSPASLPTLTVTAGLKASAFVTLSTQNMGMANVSVSVTSGAAFLSVPANVTAPGGLGLIVDASGLTPGMYTGTVQFTCLGTPSCLPVTLTLPVVVTLAPTLSAGTLSNALTATAGQTQAQCGASCMASFPLSASSGSLTYQIAASSTGNWLGVSPTSGTATATATSIMVTANPAGLAANAYTGMLTISCAAPSSCSTAQVSVTFTVNASAPTVTLTASPASVSFSAVSGRGNPAAKMVIVSASDGSAQAFTVSNVPAWLDVSPLSGTTGQASAALTLTPNAGAAPQSGVSGSFTITPSNGSAAVNVAVSLAFSAFSISANPPSLSIGVQAGGTVSQTLAIGTIDRGSAAVSVSVSGSSAVTLSSPPTTVPANITVNAHAVALQDGSNPTATITIACAAANPCTALTVPVQLNVTAGGGPIITPNGIVPLFSTATTVQTGEWISIYGTNLNPGTFLWKGDFPQSLGGTMVTIDGKNGYLSFVGQTQINVQVPDDSNTGTVEVTVNSPNGSATSTVTLGQFGPALSLLGDNKHAAGIIYRFDGSGTQGGGTYDIIGPTGNSLGFATVAAKAGDVIALFGVGFGPTTPPVPAGQPFSGQTMTNSTVTLLIDNVGIQPLTYSGLSGAGLYQFNFVLPAGLGTGDVAVQAMVGGVSTQANVAIALQ